MKNKLRFLYFITFSALLTSMYVALNGSNPYAVEASIFSVCLFSFIILASWMGYIRSLTTKSNQVLYKTHNTNSRWSFSNLEALKKNQELIAEKFKTSAALIADLVHPERITPSSLVNENDPIGKAIVNIRTEMMKIKQEGDKRTWVAQGISRFGEVLRNKTDIEHYSQNIISNLVTYLAANQGCLFIEYEEEGNRYLQLTASHAYGKSKDREQRIEPGQGIVGQCMLDKEFAFLDNIPETYVKVSSGLGQATPRSIVVAPLVFKDSFCGVIELASLHAFEAHHIEFLKEVCENIASEIVALKNVSHAEKLLEESNRLTRELQHREEEMKQNLHDLAYAQEEMIRKQTELTGIMNGVNNTIASAEFSLNGTFRNANEIFLKIMEFSKDDLEATSFPFLMGDDHSVVMMWENLRLGRFFSGEFKMRNKWGKELWLNGTFNPIILKGDIPDKIMMFAQFTTQEKEKVNELTTMVNALKATLAVIEFNANLTCKTANEKTLKIFSLTRMDLRSKTILDFIAPLHHDVWIDNQEKILSNNFTSLTLPFLIGATIVQYEVSVSVTRDLEGKIGKIIMLLVKEIENHVYSFRGGVDEQ